MKKKSTGPRVTPPGVQIQREETLDEAIARTAREMRERNEDPARIAALESRIETPPASRRTGPVEE